MDLTEAENIKKRWQEYTEELYKKDLHEPDNHDGVITHLEPDILECKVKWGQLISRRRWAAWPAHRPRAQSMSGSPDGRAQGPPGCGRGAGG